MRRNRPIRQTAQDIPWFFEEGAQLSRENAIERIRKNLQTSAYSPDAFRLIGLFSVSPEELAEAGLSYEMLKVLEKSALFI